MARALLPASFVREAPTNNQSGVPVTATRHCLVPVLPRRAKTSFPGREAAPLRFAAPSAWVQKGSWNGLRAASASAVTLCWRGGHFAVLACATARADGAALQHTRTEQEARSGNTSNGFLQPSKKKGNTGRVCGDPLPSLPLSLCAGFLPGPRTGTCSRHPHRGSPQRSRAHAVDELIQQEEEDPVGRLLHSLLPTASPLTDLTPATLRPTDS